MSLVLGLDIGTTSTTGILIDVSGRALPGVSRPTTLRSSRHGWAEEDPADWWVNVREITAALIASCGGDSSKIAVGVTGMLPAVVLLDEDSQVLRPSIQQSDGRCGREVEELRREWDEPEFLSRDVLQRPLQCLTGHPGSCLGVAWAAAICAGLTKDWSVVSALVGRGELIEPDARNAAVYDEGYRTYRKLYRPGLAGRSDHSRTSLKHPGDPAEQRS